MSAPPGWLLDWVSAQGLRVTSATTRKERPWATVWRLVTDVGVVWAKQTCPGHAHEATVHRWLADLAPDAVVPVLAADPERRLLLTADGGPTLDEDGPGLAALEQVMLEGARLQVRAYRSATRPAGVATYAPGTYADHTATAVELFAAAPPGDPRHLDADERDAMLVALPRVRRWDEEATLLPVTVQHNDLHPGNACRIEGGVRFFDFADSVLAPPLGTLLRPLAAVATLLELEPTHPRVLAHAEPALEVWSELAPLPAVRAALAPSLRLALVEGLSPWTTCYPTMTPAELADWGGVGPALLRALLLD